MYIITLQALELIKNSLKMPNNIKFEIDNMEVFHYDKEPEVTNN